MSAIVLFHYINRHLFSRQRVFRDRSHPFEAFDDEQLYAKFRFHRHIILELTAEIENEIVFPLSRLGALPPLLQVLLTLRFYATGNFLNVAADMIGCSTSTAHRTVQRVTSAFVRLATRYIQMPNQRKADQNKEKFYAMHRFPGVIGCIDGTHIRIKTPSINEHEYMNRKNYHSINVQVACDADMLFINVIAKWPGSVQDSRIMRRSLMFADFDRQQKPLDGVFLADSAFMLRDWLMTPVQNPLTQQERNYNFAHKSTRSTVEKCIKIAKKRWRCLRSGIRMHPNKACNVILVCLMLHNRAHRLNLPPLEDSSDDSDTSDDDEGYDDEGDDNACYEGDDGPQEPIIAQRDKAAAGKDVRDRLIQNCF